MKAAEVMESDVLSVRPDASVSDVAKALLSHRISAVPVIDRNAELVGIVSEGDLMRRVEVGTERHRSWWLQLLTTSEKLATEYVKSHARHAGEIMTRKVVTAEEDTSLADIATIFEHHNIKRVPIVRAGKVVGIVSRADLIRVLANLHKNSEPVAADDTAIQNEIVKQLNSESWFSSDQVEISVRDRVVKLEGVVGSPEQREAIVVAAENTAGVHAVKDLMRLKRTLAPG